MTPLASRNDKIAYLLANGASHRIVASAVGLSETYLSELLQSDEELQKVVITEAANVATKEAKTTTNARTLEDKLIELALERFDEIESPSEAIRCYTQLTKARQDQETRQALMHSGGAASQPMLHLALSAVAQQKVNILVSKNGAIVQVGNRSMAPLDYDSTVSILGEEGQDNENEAETDSDFML